MSLEIIVFFKTRPFGKYMCNLPSLEIKYINQVSGTGPLGLLFSVIFSIQYAEKMHRVESMVHDRKGSAICFEPYPILRECYLITLSCHYYADCHFIVTFKFEE